jgi:hypothetical protein
MASMLRAEEAVEYTRVNITLGHGDVRNVVLQKVNAYPGHA